MKASRLKLTHNLLFYALVLLFLVFYIKNTSIDFCRVYNEHIASLLVKILTEVLRPLIDL